MVRPSLTRRYHLGGMLAAPAIVRPQTRGLVVGAAADTAGLAH